MKIAVINRFSRRAVVLAAMVVLAGCASTGGSGDGAAGGLATYYFDFTVTRVPASGSVTNIDVQPLTRADGVYGGGNARIESQSPRDRNVVRWKSSSPFWIRFESMKSNKGNGGNKFGPGDFTRAKDDGADPYKYYFEQVLPTGGGKTESAKYFITMSGVDPSDPRKALGFELDPVIIVDR